MTNLLPPERSRALARTARVRMGVVSVVVMIVLVGVAGVLLVPTYVLLQASVDTKQARLVAIESALSSADDQELSSRLAALSKNVLTLAALAHTKTASEVLRQVIDIPRPGVVLSSFSYTPTAGPASIGVVVVSGTAATRDVLRNYQLALERAPFVRSATLPVSSFANDVEIDFMITITLAS